MPSDLPQVLSSSDLRTGDAVVALLGDAVHFRGDVLDVHPALDLFWAIDSVGDRRVIELGRYTVYRAETAQPAAGPGPAQGRGAPAGPQAEAAQSARITARKAGNER